jgi:hypothetical protein
MTAAKHLNFWLVEKTIIKLLLAILICPGAFSQKKSSITRDFIPDTTINRKLILLNYKSIVENIDSQEGKLIEDEKASRVQFANKDNTQYLIIYHEDGSNANAFNEFEVGVLKNKSKLFNTLHYDAFTTESGVKINMSLNDLITLKGGKYEKTYQNGYIVLKYRINDKNNSLLKRHNEPIFDAKYYFKDNRLVKFIFGYPNL